LKRHKDIAFFAILAAAVIVTIGFTIAYIGRAMHPAVLLREEAYIYFDGAEQVTTGIYRFENRLPMNIAIPLEYTFSGADGLGSATVEAVYFESSFRSQVLDFRFADQGRISFELNMPPFDDGVLTVSYRQPVMGKHLGYVIQSANSWEPAKKGGAVYLELPKGYEIAEPASKWIPAKGTDWDWKMEFTKEPDKSVDIIIAKIDEPE
jgi:hypothetical protein